MTRVAIAGFQHETNSFAPVPADFEAFRRAAAWPGLTIGGDVLASIEGMNLALAGFSAKARAAGDEIVPLLWANATPSGPVTSDAFERIMALMLSGLKDAAAVEAVFLDLHGAMITETHLDGETEILRRVRATAGPSVPIVATLDLHANVSPTMVDTAQALLACRTYPHIDLAETGARAHAAMKRLLARPAPIQRAYRQTDFLIPIQAQTTHLEPARSLYREAARIEQERGLLSLSLSLGFGPSDTPHCGPAIAGFGWDEASVDAAVEELAALLRAAEPRFKQPVFAPSEGVARAVSVARPGKPAVLADLQDNPGAGGTGDTTGLLAALIEAEVAGSVIASLCDPEAAKAAHAAGVGKRLHLMLGGKRGGPGSIPFAFEGTVERLGSGSFRGTGPMFGGARMELGPMALLAHPAGPGIIVATVNAQCADQSILRHLGVEPSAQKVLALKSAVHFRAAFEPIASEIILVAAGGANAADHNAFPYRHLRPGLRLMPS
jgi:microcystin degradation protein MlrC